MVDLKNLFVSAIIKSQMSGAYRVVVPLPSSSLGTPIPKQKF